MRSIPILIVSMGLFLACTSKPDRPFIPVMEEPPVLTCQETCAANADCQSGFCFEGACAECVANGDCTEGICVGGSCVACANDGDCAGSDSGALCNVVNEMTGKVFRAKAAANSCVACKADGDCGAGLRCNNYGQCTCDGDVDVEPKVQCPEPGRELCRDEGCVCSDDSGCAGEGAEKCILGICIKCVSDGDCEDGFKCFGGDTTKSFCGCTSNDQCTDSGGLCDTKDESPTQGKCVACLGNDDCADSANGKVCNAATGQCTHCAADSDCPGSTCDPSGTCVCKADADCKGPTALKWVCK